MSQYDAHAKRINSLDVNFFFLSSIKLMSFKKKQWASIIENRSVMNESEISQPYTSL